VKQKVFDMAKGKNKGGREERKKRQEKPKAAA